MSILDDSLSSLDLNSGFGSPHKRGRTTTMKRSYALGAMTLVLLIGTFVAVRLGQRSAENRQQASSPTGTVVVSTSAPASIQPGQPTSLTFAINTHDTAISGVQLTFHLEGAASVPTFESISGAGLDTFSQIVPGTSSGFDVVILGVLLPPNSLNTAQNTVDFARLHFPAATQVSAVQVTYDQAGTFTSGGANPDQDDLQTVANATFPIVQAATDTPSVSATNTPSVTSGATPTASVTPVLNISFQNVNIPATAFVGQPFDVTFDVINNSTETLTSTTISLSALWQFSPVEKMLFRPQSYSITYSTGETDSGNTFDFASPYITGIGTDLDLLPGETGHYTVTFISGPSVVVGDIGHLHLMLLGTTATLPQTVFGDATSDTEFVAALTPTATLCIQPSPPLCQASEHVECIDQNGTDYCIQCSCVANNITPTVTQCIQPSPPLCQPNEHIECVDQNGTDFCIQCNCVAGTPAPTATATSAAGSCNSIEMKYVSTGLNITAPQKGDNINFTCGEMAGAARYEFRLREPGSATFITLNPISTGARISEPYTITQAGAFRGQCRMCTGATEDSCLAWE